MRSSPSSWALSQSRSSCRWFFWQPYLLLQRLNQRLESVTYLVTVMWDMVRGRFCPRWKRRRDCLSSRPKIEVVLDDLVTLTSRDPDPALSNSTRDRRPQ